MNGAVYQDGLTIATPVKAGQVDNLRQALARIEKDIEQNEFIPFREFDSIHFARWVVLGASADASGNATPATLIFSTNFDEPREQHLDELFDKGSEALNAVYANCEGYPGENERTKENVLTYLCEHETGYNTLYIGTRGRTVVDIRQEAELRDAIQQFLDEAIRQPGFRDQQPEDIRGQIQEFVRAQPELSWTEAADEPSLRRYWPRKRDIAPIAAVVLVLIAPIIVGVLTTALTGLLVFFALLLLLAAAGLYLRFREKRDEQYPAVTDFDHVRKLAVKEDRIVQNQMSSVTNIKPGWFRLWLLRGVLLVIDLAGRYIYTKGELGTIPSIHFARWVIIDNGRRLLFFSNFDGSWENYLGDFIDKAATGLTAVWSNTHGFPRSRWLVGDGATDEQRFKAYARNSQVLTDVWYSGYKTLSVQNINNNTAIRRGLFGPLSRNETASWLQKL